MKSLHLITMVFAALLLAACSDDTKAPTPDTRKTDGPITKSDAKPDAAKPDAAKPDAAKPDAGKPDAVKPDAVAAGEWIVLVRGKPGNLTTLKATHDAIAKAGEPQAKAAGNFAHDPLLTTTDLGGTADLFLSLDRWSKVAGLAFYDDPTFKAGLSSMFDVAGYTVDKFERQLTWKGWGSLDAADATIPHYVVIVRGRLKTSFANAAAAQAAHDPVAAGGEPAAKAVGDVAHMAYLSTTDFREFLAIDVWTDNKNIATLYNDPAFKAGFGALFEDPTKTTLTVHKSTDLHTW